MVRNLLHAENYITPNGRRAQCGTMENVVIFEELMTKVSSEK
jgi:hypothetical protein